MKKDKKKRRFKKVTVKPSVAQAAMIGNPVSMPRVVHFVEIYNEISEKENVFFVEVKEQEIMDFELLANKNGHIACTQGGESLAGLLKAKKNGIVKKGEVAIINSTAHALKFSDFQTMYFEQNLDPAFNITPKKEMINLPTLISSSTKIKSLDKKSYKNHIKEISQKLATHLVRP